MAKPQQVHYISKKGKSWGNLSHEHKCKHLKQKPNQIQQYKKRIMYQTKFDLFYKTNKSSVQSLSCVQLFATPWTTACQASLSITNSQSLLKLMSIESGMPSNHLILCHPLLLLPSIFPSIRVFSNEQTLHHVPKYWSFPFSTSPSN